MQKESNGLIDHIVLNVLFLCLGQIIAEHSVSKVEFLEPQPVYMVEPPSDVDQNRLTNPSNEVRLMPSSCKVVDLNKQDSFESSERLVPAFGSHPARIERADGSSKPLCPVIGSDPDELPDV